MLAALVLALSPWGHAAAMPVGARAHADETAGLRGLADEARRDAPDDGDTADEDGDDTEPRGDDEPSSDEERLAEAGAAFTRGVEAYKQERYADAVVYFNRAQRLAPHPDTLYNLGLAQQRSDDHVGAIATFETLLQQTTDAGEREDILAAQAVSRGQVVVLRVQTDAPLVCLDGEPMTMRDGTRSTLTTPGTHRLDIGAHHRTLELQGGETRTVEMLEATDSRAPIPRRGRLALAGIGIAGAGAAAGLGLGAGLVRPVRMQMGLGIGAAAAGTVAVTSGVIALVLERRHRKGRRRGRDRTPASAAPLRCPAP